MDRMITKTLAEIYLKQGDLRKAYEILKILSEQDPSDKDVWKKLVELSERLGLSPPTLRRSDPLTEQKITMLKKVLANIRERRKG
jgi:DNA-binding SARP family transcriptional activator